MPEEQWKQIGGISMGNHPLDVRPGWRKFAGPCPKCGDRFTVDVNGVATEKKVECPSCKSTFTLPLG